MKRSLNIDKMINFFRQDIWRIRSQKLPRKWSFLLKQLRIIILAFRGFFENKCSLMASALTFYSLLSVVPTLALIFGVAKGFGLQKLLEEDLLERFRGQEEVIVRIIAFAHSVLENTRSGLIAGIGVTVLLWLIIKLLGNIENSFNEIWGIERARTFGRKLSDYLLVMLTCPMLLVASSSITVFISTQVTHITDRIALLGIFSPLVSLVVKGIPYYIIWVLFTFIFIIMPNTRVRFRSALLAGVVAGTLYQIVQQAYITFQIGVVKYGAIYGSFAALPLFLVWLQVSWLIIFFGAEISFASQNVGTYEFEQDSSRSSPSFKRMVALLIAHVCVKNFCNADKPWSAKQISHLLEIPTRLVNHLLFDLVQSHVLSAVRETSESEPLYQPAIDLNNLSLNYVIQAIDSLGRNNIPIALSEERGKIADCLKEFAAVIENSRANLLLKDI